MPRILPASSLRFGERLGDLDAAALAAAAGMDLRFDYNAGCARVEQRFGCRFCFFALWLPWSRAERRHHISSECLLPDTHEFS